MKIGWLMKWGDFQGECIVLTPEKMTSHQILADGEVWWGHPLAGPNFEVRSRMVQTTGGLTTCSLAYSGYEGEKYVEEVRFPLLKVPYDEESRVLDAVVDLGLILRDEPLLTRGKEHIYECHSTSLFALLYPNQTGFYLDCRAEEASPKSFCFTPSEKEDTAEIGVVFHLSAENTPRASWLMPGNCTFGQYAGGWYEAARLYRQWAIQQPWFTNRIEVNPLRNIGLWVWNRGEIKTAIPPVLELRRQLPDIPIALDWYWWHHNPYDTDYPDFWPPREGEEPFRQTIAMLSQNNIFTQVYMNGMACDMDSPAWKNCGEEGVMLLRDGTPKNYAFNRYNHHRLAWMCGEAAAFQDRLAEQIRKLYECGLSGQYLDMIGYDCNIPCYNPKHRHPRGGSTAVAMGYRKFLARLKREFPNFRLSTEGCNEHLMDLLDGVIVCNTLSVEHFGGQNEVVPVFPAIYHGPTAMAMFGNFALPDGIPPWDPLWPSKDRREKEEPWHLLYPEQFFIDMLRNVLFGTQPMVCNLTEKIYTDPAFAKHWKFILELTRFYHQNLDWLFDGEMLSPDGFSCASRKVKFLHRMIFTKEGEEKGFTREMPAILHSVWKNPHLERKALFVGNYTDSCQEGQYGQRYFQVPPRKCLRIDLD